MRWILALYNNHVNIRYQQVLQLSLTKEKQSRKDPLIEIVVDTSSSLLIIKNFR